MNSEHELPRDNAPLLSCAVAVPKPLSLLSTDDLKKVAGGQGATTLRENTMF